MKIVWEISVTFWKVDARETALANALDAREFGVNFRQKMVRIWGISVTFWKVDARETALVNHLDAREFGVDFRQKNDENLGDFGHFLGSRRT